MSFSGLCRVNLLGEGRGGRSGAGQVDGGFMRFLNGVFRQMLVESLHM